MIRLYSSKSTNSSSSSLIVVATVVATTTTRVLVPVLVKLVEKGWAGLASNAE